MELCQICNLENPPSSHFWRTHKIKEKDYYLKFYNKIDLYTGEPLPFKNRDSYLSSYFKNKNNMKKYINELPTIKDKTDFCTYLLMHRKEKKGLIYIPTQVELKTTMLPPMGFYDQLDNYKQICLRLGFKDRYNHYPQVTAPKDIKIQIDTREQKTFKFSVPYEIATLKYGDYRLNQKKYSSIVIERKSLNDFIGSFSRNFDRLKKEIQKAQEDKAYMVVLVEEALPICNVFNRLNQFKSIKATPDYVFHNVRQLLSEFKDLQFLFVSGRKESQRIIEKILLAGNYYQGMDLQYEYDKCEL